MVDPMYHVAFQNTMKKAMAFIDRQLQDWSIPTKASSLFTERQNAIHSSSYSTSTSSSSTTAPSLLSDSIISSLNIHDDDLDEEDDNDENNNVRTPCSFSPRSPPPYLFLPSTSTQTAVAETEAGVQVATLSPSSTCPPTIITTEANQPQPVQRLKRADMKPRPLSMPILPSSPPIPGTPPPLYSNTKKDDDDTYTRAISKWQHRRSCLILPREEEGKEDLPPYHCSVYKMGKVNVKTELHASGRKINRRPWRRLYIELWGTVLRIYPLTWFWNTVGKEPLYTISLAGAEASRAVDYVKRPFVVRLAGLNGIQLLIQLSNYADMISWIEDLQSGINISLDLEERPMPKFLTLQPRRGNDNGILCPRMIEVERRREQRRRNQQEILG